MTQLQCFPTTKKDFEIWKARIEGNNKEICSYCEGKLTTYEKGHRLYRKIFICLKCDTVYENRNGKLIKSERLAVV